MEKTIISQIQISHYKNHTRLSTQRGYKIPSLSKEILIVNGKRMELSEIMERV